MIEVVPGVYRMEKLLGAHAYLLLSDKGAVLVDSGIRADADKIIAQVAQVGHIPPIQSIVLTHFHGDHVGGAAKLSRQWGAQVMAHKEDAPFIARPSSIPAFSSPKQLINWMGANVVLRSQASKIERILEDGDEVEALDGCIIIHTPGHTAGSICLYQPDRQILFCGDAIFNVNPINQKPGMGLYLQRITLDNAQAIQSAKKLGALPVKVICFGHGEPIVEGAGKQMEQFITNIETSS